MVELTQTQRDFREGMSRLGAAVNLITTDGPAGRHGITASAVCSVTDAPPTLITCINKSAYAHDRFVENGVLAVNVLASEHQALSAHFARYVEGVDRFAFGDWDTARTGSPMLADANVAFDCRITGRHEEGTHSVFFCQVVAVRLSEEARHGLVWFSRDYHHLNAEQA
ncbi:flavin reductase [Celeribacter neptunius]|uniref:Flavin reductase n=1 Tax=Celeribacter neptunius TaxID=588602 RepID=A0A1I3NKY9_9RHOB|nr:flavin reductase [Celeribacter neptunius]SFJ09832.1 flavin reductase [Celeribacter neptunius]